jgi:hypothetical protein
LSLAGSQTHQHYNNATDYSHPISFPSIEEAFELLDITHLYIGETQTYFDSREVLASIDRYYQDPDNPPPPSLPWVQHLFLIFALGRLLRAKQSSTNSNPPGFDLFEYAHSYLPSPREQFANGRTAIELLGLLAVFMQCVQQQENAFIYVSKFVLCPCL